MDLKKIATKIAAGDSHYPGNAPTFTLRETERNDTFVVFEVQGKHPNGTPFQGTFHFEFEGALNSGAFEYTTEGKTYDGSPDQDGENPEEVQFIFDEIFDREGLNDNEDEEEDDSEEDEG